MQTVVNYFAEALKWIDNTGVPFRSFQPGVGPYCEPQLLKKSLEFLKGKYQEYFNGARTKREPDILIPGKWCLEFKIVRPFGDNGIEAEHWSQNLLHPYYGNVSSLGDALKLTDSNYQERKGIVVCTYEHMEPRIDLEPLVKSFEMIAVQILNINLGNRFSETIEDLVHPVHQRATVYGWEVFAA